MKSESRVRQSCQAGMPRQIIHIFTIYRHVGRKYSFPPREQNHTMTAEKKRMKVCLFGLSADPPTGESGHVGIVKALSEMDEFDQVRVLPVYRHTFSVSAHPVDDCL